MDVLSVCRCCLSQGIHKKLNEAYVWMDKTEIYCEMIQECFNLTLSLTPVESHGICDACIEALRSSLCFKQQVLTSEEELMKRFSDSVKDEKPLLEVKLEPKPESDDDSDDYFLSSCAREDSVRKVKRETRDPTKRRQTKRKAKGSKKGKDGENWRSDEIKTLVSRLATSINSRDTPEINIQKKEPRAITIKEPELKKKLLLWTKNSHDKSKHKENLETILKYSNATPFKNKSLLGYMCGYCDASYPDPVDLRLHTKIDHKKERLSFKSNFDMTEYVVKLDTVDLSCTLCDQPMSSLADLKEHLVKTHKKIIHTDIMDHILQFKLKKGDVYDCAMCSSTYETFKMLKQHMNKHYSNYCCNKCDSSFATKRSLNAHRTTHQEGNFKCDHCEKIFSSKTKKHYHEKMKHLGARNISNCPYCNEPFRSYYQRNQHLIKVHNSEAQYKCNVCNKSYVLKSLLMYHIKQNHLMERNCQCTECGYRFFSKKALKAHMIKHSGEKIYVCEVCHKSYARKYTLREHMRIHNNDRRFKCDVCAMTFVQKCSLKNHLLSNHGISMAASDIVST